MSKQMAESTQHSRPMIADWLRGERRYLQDATDRTKEAMQAAENALMEAHERIKVLEAENAWFRARSVLEQKAQHDG
jgi:hypothetical protein